MTLRFIHISDTHIGTTSNFTNYGHNAQRNLERVIDVINGLTFEVAFVLHTGDVVEDMSEAAYRVAKPILARLRLPIYYVAGNHDDAALLQRVLLDREPSGERFDYQFTAGGIQFAVFDSRSPRDPSGVLQPEQIAKLRALATPDGPPLVIILHHPPAQLDTRWLDEGWTRATHTFPPMPLENHAEFIATLAPAAARVRGVFAGHVHRGFQVLHSGLLISAGASTFAQLAGWPDQTLPEPVPHELGGFDIVTLTESQTTIRHIGVARPEIDT